MKIIIIIVLNYLWYIISGRKDDNDFDVNRQ